MQTTHQKPYWAKLQDPRWQAKRKQVLERYKFICNDCGKRDVPLDVHHLCYFSKREPWEYPDWNFVALCRECHDEVTNSKSSFLEQAMENFGCQSEFFLFCISVPFRKIPDSKKYLLLLDLAAYASQQQEKGDYNAD